MRMAHARRRSPVRHGLSQRGEDSMRIADLWVAAVVAASMFGQPGVLTKELLVRYTPDWKGERFADGRPKVSDGILKRMKSVTLEEAWAQLRTAGFNH